MCLQWRSSQITGRATYLNGTLSYNMDFNISAIKTSIMRLDLQFQSCKMFAVYYEGNNVWFSSLGIPVTVTNPQTKESLTDPLQLFLYLNKIGYDQMYFKAKCVY